MPLISLLEDMGMNLLSSFIDKGKSKALKIIKDKTGVDLKDRENLNDEEINRLKEFEKRNKDFILNKLSLYIQDAQNARATYTTINTSNLTPAFNKIFPSILAGLTVMSTFILFYFFTQGNFEGSKKDIVIYILGLLSSISAQIYSFYFGSSEGSKQKSDAMMTMHQQTKKR